MLNHRPRRWPSNKPTSVQHHVFAGIGLFAIKPCAQPGHTEKVVIPPDFDRSILHAHPCLGPIGLSRARRCPNIGSMLGQRLRR